MWIICQLFTYIYVYDLSHIDQAGGNKWGTPQTPARTWKCYWLQKNCWGLSIPLFFISCQHLRCKYSNLTSNFEVIKVPNIITHCLIDRAPMPQLLYLTTWISRYISFWILSNSQDIDQKFLRHKVDYILIRPVQGASVVRWCKNVDP